jgi:Ca2+:H+ antiporter
MAGLSRFQVAMLAAILTATVLAGVGRYAAGIPDLVAFGLATLALAGMAWIVSFSTEEVGRRYGPAVTGVMQSTLGNLPEFFVVLFALGSGQLVVAQTSILGSILVNALLVLGLVLVAGARQSSDGRMRFHVRLPNDTATLLLISTFIIVLIGLSNSANDAASHHFKAISTIGAVCILGVYLAWIVPYLRSDAAAAGEPQEREAPSVPLSLSAGLLALGGLASAFVSDWFVHALEPTIKLLDLSPSFAGLVIVAIAGNAVENVTGIVLAAKGQADLAISVVKNSVAQVAAFLFPLLVLVSLAFSTSLTFALAPVYIGALLGTSLVIWQITSDGEATAFEGWALVGTFVILATVAFYE